MKKNKEITIRSSAAEYLTYVATVGDQPDAIEIRYEDENVWLTQKMMEVVIYTYAFPGACIRIYNDGNCQTIG